MYNVHTTCTHKNSAIHILALGDVHDGHSDTGDDVTDDEAGLVANDPTNDGHSGQEKVQPAMTRHRRSGYKVTINIWPGQMYLMGC